MKMDLIGTAMKKYMAGNKKDASTKDVSLVILTCGNYQWLRQTIYSILQQDCRIKEVILSDDGSSKPFPEEAITMLQRLRPQADRLLIRHNPVNLGTVAHMNHVAALCKGTYIKFLAAGDAFFTSDALSKLVCFAQEQQTLAVSSNVAVCSEDLSQQYYLFPGGRHKQQIPPPEMFGVLCRANRISAVGTLLHRDFFEKFGGFDPSYHLLEDWPAWLRLTRTGHAIPFLPQVTCSYAVGGISSKRMDAFCETRLREDMIRCCEQEILPYSHRLDAAALADVHYNYDRLKGMGTAALLRKYPMKACRTKIKRCIKWGLFKLHHGTRHHV